jgi:O-Antigen ligase
MTAEPPSRSSRPFPALPEKLVCTYLSFIPVLWILGLNLPIAFFVMFGTFAIFVRSRFAWWCALPWFLVGTMQIVSVITNWLASSQPLWMLAKHFLASYVSGWFMLGTAVAIGASGLVRLDRIVAAVRLLTIWSVAIAIPAYVLSLVLSAPYLFVLSPVGHLIPASLPSRGFSFGMFVYSWDEFFGLHLPRISLFYPWPNVLGVAGICNIFIFWGHENRWVRWLGVTVGIFLTLASLSRLILFALLLCIPFRILLGFPRRVIAAVTCGALSMALGAFLWIGMPRQIITAAESFVDSGRAGSSEARRSVYDASWDSIRHAPIVGHGWPGELLSWDDTESVYGTQAGAFVGTHSTISGLLYKGGVLTFGAFVLAMVITSARIVPYLSVSGRARSALTILLSLGITAVGEGLESLVVPLLFVFVWLGTVIASLRTQRSWV